MPLKEKAYNAHTLPSDGRNVTMGNLRFAIIFEEIKLTLGHIRDLNSPNEIID